MRPAPGDCSQTTQQEPPANPTATKTVEVTTMRLAHAVLVRPRPSRAGRVPNRPVCRLDSAAVPGILVFHSFQVAADLRSTLKEES